jgi:hypothetical protein
VEIIMVEELVDLHLRDNNRHSLVNHHNQLVLATILQDKAEITTVEQLDQTNHHNQLVLVTILQGKGIIDLHLLIL